MKLFHLLLIGILGTGVAGAATVPSHPIGQVISIQGRVTAQGTNGQERVLAAKSPIFSNDHITTVAGAKVQMRMTDDSLLCQGEKSEMTLDSFAYDPGDATNVNCLLTLVRGAFRVVTGKIAVLNPERFTVKTQMVTIGIRGCELAFRVDASGEAKVYVLDLPKNHRIVVEPKPAAGGEGRSESLLAAAPARAEKSNALSEARESAGSTMAAAKEALVEMRSRGLQVREAGTLIGVRKTGEIVAPVQYDRKEVDALIGATTL